MIESEDQRVHWLVGLFLFLGLVLLGTLIIAFGRFEDRARGRYPITLTFPEASGVVEGAEVRLGGAKVGRVASAPELTASYDGVTVGLGMFRGVRIPKGSRFVIGRSGLLGDAYISVEPPEELTGEFIEEGSVLPGEGGSGLGDLQDTAAQLSVQLGDAITDLRGTLSTLNRTLEKLDREILSETNTGRVDTILANLETTSAKIGSAADRFDEFLVEGRATVASARETLDKAGEAADSLKPAVEELRPALSEVKPALEDLRATLQSANALIGEIRGGRGLLSTLIQDEALRDDTALLLRNLRRHGVLFYRDDTPEAEGGTPPAASERRAPTRPPHRRFP